MAMTCPGCNKEIHGVISKERFDEVNNEKKELKEKLTVAETQLGELGPRAKEAEDLKAQLEKATGERTAVDAKWQRHLALSDAGIKDPDVRDVFEGHFAKLDPKEAGDFGKWMQGLTSAPDKAPAVLRPFLPQKQEQSQGGQKQAPQQPAWQGGGGSPDRGGVSQDLANRVPGGASYDAKSIAAMSPQEYLKNRQAIATATGIDLGALPPSLQQQQGGQGGS